MTSSGDHTAAASTPLGDVAHDDPNGRSGQAASAGLVETIAALRDGRITGNALLERTLAVADAHGELNGFISLASESTLCASERMPGRGLLTGVPLVIKDNIHVAGLPNTAGTPALRDFMPLRDAPAVQRLRDEGALVLGKTNLHELALGITSNNIAYGAVRNAWDHRMFAGGSSGGTAALIAAGVVSAGLGTDTGGSVRIPAALNGICGLRPTTGRYLGGGVTPLSSTRDTVGPMAICVADIVLLDQILSGDTAPVMPCAPPTLRLGVPRSHFTEALDDDVRCAWDETRLRLTDAGVTLVPVEVAEIASLDAEIGMTIVLHESATELAAYLARNVPDLTLPELTAKIASPDVKAAFQTWIDHDAPQRVPDDAYAEAVGPKRDRLRSTYKRLFEDHRIDALIFPTTPACAQPRGSADREFKLNGVLVPTFDTFIRNTSPGSVAGLPGMSIPMGQGASGLPVGLAVDGPERTDKRLLAIVLALEEILRPTR